MKNELINTIKLYNCNIDFVYLNQIITSFKLNGNFSFLVFDLINNKFIYYNLSRKQEFDKILEEYQNKGFQFLKNICHPLDFSIILYEILTLIYSAKYYNERIIKSDNEILLRIKDGKNNWQGRKLHLIYLNECEKKVFQAILGLIDETMINHNNSSLKITEREKEIFNFLSSGYSAKMIADMLNISETTVITHRKNLIHKLEVKNSAELIKKGVELNLIN
jgi:DNA-binding CsgD family transcriptional regulator